MRDRESNGLTLQIQWLDRFHLAAEQLARGDLREVPFRQLNVQKVLGRDFIPYKTQVHAWQEILNENTVFVVSGTGSGKTYAILLGILEKLLKNSSEHCLVMFPMKALAQDQEVQLRNLCAQFNFTVQRYDSSVDPEVKAKIRETPGELLIITPDTLLGSLSGSKNEKWRKYLASSSMIWIDEFHAMSGTLGTALCYLLRILHELQPTLRIYCTSATLANVYEIVRQFPSPPTIIEGGSQHGDIRIHVGTVYQFPKVLELVLRDTGQFLLFLEHKRKIEEIMAELSLFSRHVERYHADLPDGERHLILEKFRKKELKGLLCTSALGLGINIPSVRNIILYRFPRSFSLLFQEMGRGTREYNTSGNLYLLLDDTRLIDTYYLHHLPELKADIFSYQSEPVILDLLNTRILRGMILFAVKMGLTTLTTLRRVFKEAQDKGHLERSLTWLLTRGYISKKQEEYSFLPTSATPFLFDFILNLRPGFPKFKIVQLVPQTGEKLELGYITAEEIPYRACRGNYFSKARCCYAIQAIDIHRREIHVVENEEHYVSKNQVLTTLTLVTEIKFKTIERGVQVQLAEFRVQIRPQDIRNFRVLQTKLGESYPEPSFAPKPTNRIGRSFELNFTTKGVLLEFSLSQTKEMSESVLYQLAKLMLKVAVLLVNVSENEVDCFQDFCSHRLYFLDRSGPTGVSQQLYTHMEAILRKTYQILVTCPCENGCEKCAIPLQGNYLMPNFQSNDPYRKKELLTLLREVLLDCE